MSVNNRIVKNNPIMGANTAIVTVAATDAGGGGASTAKADAVNAIGAVLAAYAAGQGPTVTAATLTVAGLLYSTPAGSAVHLYTTNSTDPGIIIATGETLYVPGANQQLMHASAAAFGILVYFNEDQ